MSPFNSYLPEFEAAMDRVNPGRNRPAPRPQTNNAEPPRRPSRNEMFFTDDDDVDSIFGDADISTIDNSDTVTQPTQYQIHERTQAIDPTNIQGPGGRSTQDRYNTFVPTYNTFDNVHYAQRNVAQPPLPPIFINQAPAVPAQPIFETIYIKDEEANMEAVKTPEYIQNVPAAQRVKIFVGRENRAVYVDRADLSKSPTLLSWIVEGPNQAPFIMRPNLVNTNLDDFISIAEFLHSGEYGPLLVENAADPGGPKILAGLRNDDDYGNELIKSGRLYRLATRFGVEGLEELVVKKITQVDPGKFSTRSLLIIADIVLRDRKKEKGTVTAPKSNGGSENNENEDGTTGDAGENGSAVVKDDPLEEWIIGKLAFNFQEIMRTQREKFFELVKNTGQRVMFARVMEQAAREYRASGGQLPKSVIQLD